MDGESGGGGVRIKVVPIVFTQGVNVAQSLVNTARNFVPTMGNIQEHTNYRSLELLNRHIRALRSPRLQTVWNALSKEHGGDYALPKSASHDIERMRLQLQHAVESTQLDPARKAIDVLQHAAALVRAIGGGRATMCKSAKDRTSMSVTLECARLLVAHEHVCDSKDSLKLALALFRTQGVRLRNCFANVGKPRYAFNFFQRKMLPKLYRPPRVTIASVQT